MIWQNTLPRINHNLCENKERSGEEGKIQVQKKGEGRKVKFRFRGRWGGEGWDRML